MLKTNSQMLVLLIILIFIYNIGAAIYQSQGLEPLPTFEFLYHAAFLSGVIWWFRAEKKRSAVTGAYCQGMLVGIGWLVIIPYHLLKTRGIKGLLPLFALVGSFLLAQMLAAIIYFAFTNQS